MLFSSFGFAHIIAENMVRFRVIRKTRSVVLRAGDTYFLFNTVLQCVFRSSELTHDYPFQKIVKSAFSGCDLNNDIGQLLLCVFELYPVQRKEYEHCVRAYAFVSIDKRMVFYEPVS